MMSTAVCEALIADNFCTMFDIANQHLEIRAATNQLISAIKEYGTFREFYTYTVAYAAMAYEAWDPDFYNSAFIQAKFCSLKEQCMAMNQSLAAIKDELIELGIDPSKIKLPSIIEQVEQFRARHYDLYCREVDTHSLLRAANGSKFWVSQTAEQADMLSAQAAIESHNPNGWSELAEVQEQVKSKILDAVNRAQKARELADTAKENAKLLNDKLEVQAMELWGRQPTINVGTAASRNPYYLVWRASTVE